MRFIKLDGIKEVFYKAKRSKRRTVQGKEEVSCRFEGRSGQDEMPQTFEQKEPMREESRCECL